METHCTHHRLLSPTVWPVITRAAHETCAMSILNLTCMRGAPLACARSSVAVMAETHYFATRPKVAGDRQQAFRRTAAAMQTPCLLIAVLSLSARSDTRHSPLRFQHGGETEPCECLVGGTFCTTHAIRAPRNCTDTARHADVTATTGKQRWAGRAYPPSRGGCAAVRFCSDLASDENVLLSKQRASLIHRNNNN